MRGRSTPPQRGADISTHPGHHSVGEGVHDAVHAVHEAADSRYAHAFARAGLVARAVVYVVIGILALRVAFGREAEADQRGAVTQLLHQPFGEALVVLMTIGLAGYAAWRLSEAAFGAVGDPGSKAARVQSAWRGGIYAFFTVSAISILFGSEESQVGQQQGVTAEVLSHTGGRTVVGIVGIGVILTGLFLAVEGATRKFMRYFPASHIGPRRRRTIAVLGALGNTARGLVFTLAGILLVVGAWHSDPDGATGIDGAVDLMHESGANGLVVVSGLGLIVFGAYGLLEARYRRV